MKRPLWCLEESVALARGLDASNSLLPESDLASEHLRRDARYCVSSDSIDEILIGEGAAMTELKRVVRRVAPAHATVLITGETGSGKECVAQAVHRLCRRRCNALVSMNCAAIPEGLLEGELFGYERGAFTGAQTAYPGKLKLADGGTLFLDEVGDMSMQAQAKILRALETREIFRLGANRSVPFDVRVIAATNQPLTALASGERFRKDLFFRLSVAHIRVPPLREHSEDIPVLANHYVRVFNRALDRSVRGFDAAAMALLRTYHWPGNVRELRNAIEIAFINAEADHIGADDLPEAVRAAPSGRSSIGR
jgi:DNA-binding NtrC family response regulator